MPLFNHKQSRFTARVVLCGMLLPLLNYAQTVKSAGKDFWLGYGAHTAMFNADGSVNTGGGQQDMVLYLSATTNSTVTVEMPQTGWSKTITLRAGTIDQQIIIPKTGGSDARLTTEGVLNKGIHITSNNAINAYCHIYSPGSSASTLLLSEEMLGQEYYALGAKQATAEKNGFSYCFVVAAEDGTTVEITPSANTLKHTANIPFTVQLNKGQVYNLAGAPTGNINGINTGTDLTGTHIRTISTGVGPCKKIAVFAGSSGTAVSCSAGGTADNLFQQVLPYRAWGKTYFAVPPAKMPNATYRVFINMPTKVTVNGTALTTPVNGSYYEFTTSEPAVITSSNPVMVAQYISSQGQCGNTGNGTDGDPDMIYLSPRTPSSFLAVLSPGQSGITSHYINVVVRTFTVNMFTIDNVKKKELFKPFAANPQYSYAQIPVTAGTHTLQVDTLGFSAVMYGYGPQESYGYNGFIYVANLSGITVKNPYSDANQANPCKGVPFNIEYTLKQRATELVFDFGQNPYLSPNGAVDLKNPVPDSAYQSGTDSFFRYTLPAKYTYAPAGAASFNVDITENIFTAEGCIEQRTVTYPINVDARPVAGINVNYKTCGDTVLHFNDSSAFANGSFKSWTWKFGNGVTSASQNPVEQYNAYGDYTIALRSITNNGCYADTFKKISLNPVPKVNFGISGLYCPLNNIQFTDSSQVNNGWQISTRQWSFGDGSTAAIVNPVMQYASGGNYTVKLLETTNKGCTDSAIKNITIYAAPVFNEFVTVKNPLAAINNLQACSLTPFRLSVTFTVRQTQIQWGFANNTNLSPNNDVDVTAPAPDSIYFNGQDSFFRYSLPASYTYSAPGTLPVKVTAFTPTKGGCTAQTVFNHNIQVLGKPVAAWLLNYNSCSNDTLHFKDASLAGGQNIQTWQWNFADGTTDSAANPVKKYAAYGEYTVHLHIITDIGCYADTTAQVALSPAPVANFTYTAPLYCTGSNIAFADSSFIQQPFAIAKWVWDFGDATNAETRNANRQFNTAGTYAVKLTVYSNHNCTDTITKHITIYNYPVITMPANVYMASGSTLQLTPSYTGTGLTYLWYPPDFLNNDTASLPVTAAIKNIAYLLTVTGNGRCVDTVSVTVHVEKQVEVPNAFSPNGDGINDTWRITNIEDYPACTVRVFNRYGQAVFSSTGYNKPWDGTTNNKALPVGTYYYIIETKSVLFPGKNGSVTILR